jgi:NAD-dependent deacetylase
MDPGIGAVRGWVDESTRIVVLTGAGISTDSGIPDFRGPQGVWTKNPMAEKLSNIHYYMADPEVRKASWKARMDHTAWNAKPNAGHLALAALEKRGKLHALITQNIDELHQMAGNSPQKVFEVHGTMRKGVCMSCSMTAPMQKALDRVRAGEDDPAVPQLRRHPQERHHLLRPGLVPEVIDGAMRAAARPTCFSPSAPACRSIRSPARCRRRAPRVRKIVIMNAEPTPFDDLADALFHDSISKVLPQLCAPS